MQNLTPAALAAICMAFHRISQRGLPVAMVGTGLPQLPRLLRDAKPYAEGLFQYRSLGQLSDAAARGALLTPATRQGVEYQEDAACVIVADMHRFADLKLEYVALKADARRGS
jgi:hypothetical protein